MPKQDFIPNRDGDFVDYHDNFKAAATSDGVTVGLTPAVQMSDVLLTRTPCQDEADGRKDDVGKPRRCHGRDVAASSRRQHPVTQYVERDHQSERRPDRHQRSAAADVHTEWKSNPDNDQADERKRVAVV